MEISKIHKKEDKHKGKMHHNRINKIKKIVNNRQLLNKNAKI